MPVKDIHRGTKTVQSREGQSGAGDTSTAVRVTGTEKAPIALIKGMNGGVVGGQLEGNPSNSA